MNLALIPLLLVALLMAGADPGLDRAELLWDGAHEVTDHQGVLMVGDADVAVPAGARLPGPVYLIGGRLDLDGRIDGDVVQLAGTLDVSPSATVQGELRHVAGTLRVAEGATVGRLSRVTVAAATESPASRIVTPLATMLTLAAAAMLLARRRADRLATISAAVLSHPVITVTLGTLLALTLLALIVFMAFTVVLIPVAVLALLAAAATVAVGVVALGHAVGTRLPIRGGTAATGVGTALVAVALQVLGGVPVVGDLIALAVLAAGFGAVLVTYLGLAPLRPDRFGVPLERTGGEGTTDAGTTDAGTTDAGTTDAGTTDADATDAGTTDADAVPSRGSTTAT
jgi:hypothetical protein